MDSVVYNIGNIAMRSDIAIEMRISLMNGKLHSFLFFDYRYITILLYG